MKDIYEAATDAMRSDSIQHNMRFNAIQCNGGNNMMLYAIQYDTDSSLLFL